MASESLQSCSSLLEADIPQRTVACQALFAAPRSSMPDISEVNWFEYREAEFNLWCKVMKANRKGKSSLELRVRNHAGARQLIQDLLDGLCESLKDLLRLARLRPSMIAECASQSKHSDATSEVSSSNGDSKHSSETEPQQDDSARHAIDARHAIEYHMFYIKATIAQLVDLSTKIRQSGVKYRYQKADESLKEGDFDDYVQSWKSSILGGKLEKATAAVPYQTGAIAEFLHESRLTIVQRRLIRANLLRRNRIQFVRESHVDHEEPITITEGTSEPQSTDQEVLDREPDVISQALPNENTPYQASPEVVPSVSYTATEIGSQFDLSVFRKEKPPSVATRATRIGGRDDLEYPKCPKPPTFGTPVTCPYCADILPEKFHRIASIWRKHVANDILPYTCYYENCDTPDLMWSTSEKLMDHLNQSHSRTEWTCPWCTSDFGGNHLPTFSSRQYWETHVTEKHQGISPSTGLSSLSEICKRITLEPVSCPLCTHGTDSTQLVDDDHILWHIHDFALKCFPWEDATEEDDEDQVMTEFDLGIFNEEIEDLYSFDMEDNHTLSLDLSEYSSNSSDLNIPSPPNLHDSINDTLSPTPTPAKPEPETEIRDFIASYLPGGSSGASFKRSPNSRQRVVKNVDRVDRVRVAGACIRCRVQKVTCSPVDPCETCKKLGQQATEFSCIRGDLTSVAKELSPRRFPGLRLDRMVYDTLRTAGPQFQGPVFEGQIFLEPDGSMPGLRATLRNYTCAASNHGGCTFTRNPENRVLNQDGLVDWASQYVSFEDHRTFEGRIEYFIKQYAMPSHYNPYRTAQRPKTGLLQKVHTLKAMCKIYRSTTLYFIRSGEIKLSELPLPAQAEIRSIARSVIESSERDILADLDRYLKPIKSKMDNHERPAVWAALWQLMFIYRDLLRNVKPWHGNAEPLLNAVAVFYASLFRTSAALKLLSLDSVKGHWPAGETQQAGLTKAFDDILELRDTFHQRIAAGVDAIDQRLKVLVVDPEIKVLNRRRNPKKLAGMKIDAPEKYDDDVNMTGC